MLLPLPRMCVYAWNVCDFCLFTRLLLWFFSFSSCVTSCSVYFVLCILFTSRSSDLPKRRHKTNIKKKNPQKIFTPEHIAAACFGIWVQVWWKEFLWILSFLRRKRRIKVPIRKSVRNVVRRRKQKCCWETINDMFNIIPFDRIVSETIWVTAIRWEYIKCVELIFKTAYATGFQYL